MMTSVDCDLKIALFEWQARTAPVKFPPALVRDFGAKVLLFNNIINRIVMCAQAGKLSSTADLLKETKWKKELIGEFGKSLLAIVCIHRPVNLPPEISMEAGPPTCKTTGLGKCSVCGNTGHNSKSIGSPFCANLTFLYTEANQNCPKQAEQHRQMLMKVDAENIDPQRREPPPTTIFSQSVVTQYSTSPSRSLVPTANHISCTSIPSQPQQYLQLGSLAYAGHSHYHSYQLVYVLRFPPNPPHPQFQYYLYNPPP
jgi:hypothetical protein